MSHYNVMYHMFYGGTKLMGPRTENIGYAYSLNELKANVRTEHEERSPIALDGDIFEMEKPLSDHKPVWALLELK